MSQTLIELFNYLIQWGYGNENEGLRINGARDREYGIGAK